MVSRTSGTTPDIHDNRDNGALSSLDISGSSIHPEGICAISEVISQSPITQLNLANNWLAHDPEFHPDMSGIVKFANAIQQDKGALSKFTFSGDFASKPVTVEVDMTELDCSGTNLNTSGAIILAAWLQHK